MKIKSILSAILFASTTLPAQAELSGFYAGASILNSGNQSWDWYQNNAFVNSYPLDGSAPGLFAGYNWNLGTITLGAELAFHGEGIVEPTDPGYNIQRIIDLKARIGTEIGSVFVYGFAGPSFARWDDFFQTIDVSGHSYGIGAQLPLSERAFFGIEYSEHALSGEYIEANLGRLWRHEIDFQSVAFRLGMRF